MAGYRIGEIEVLTPERVTDEAIEALRQVIGIVPSVVQFNCRRCGAERVLNRFLDPGILVEYKFACESARGSPPCLNQPDPNPVRHQEIFFPGSLVYYSRPNPRSVEETFWPGIIEPHPYGQLPYVYAPNNPRLPEAYYVTLLHSRQFPEAEGGFFPVASLKTFVPTVAPEPFSEDWKEGIACANGAFYNTLAERLESLTYVGAVIHWRSRMLPPPVPPQQPTRRRSSADRGGRRGSDPSVAGPSGEQGPSSRVVAVRGRSTQSHQAPPLYQHRRRASDPSLSVAGPSGVGFPQNLPPGGAAPYGIGLSNPSVPVPSGVFFPPNVPQQGASTSGRRLSDPSVAGPSGVIFPQNVPQGGASAYGRRSSDPSIAGPPGVRFTRGASSRGKSHRMHPYSHPQGVRAQGAGPSTAGPSMAGPSGAGPSGAGPSGAGPSGAGPSRGGQWSVASPRGEPPEAGEKRPLKLRLVFEDRERRSPPK